MNSVYKYYVNPEGYGKFVHHLNHLIYTYNGLRIKSKILDNSILIVISNDYNDVYLRLYFNEYNEIVDALTAKNYSAHCISKFDYFIKGTIFNKFYNSKFI